MRCRDDGTTLQTKENGFVCPICGRTTPYRTKTKHEPKRHIKKPTDAAPVYVRS